MTWWRAAQDQAHIRVAACCGCTNIPRPSGGAQEAGTILSVGCW